MTDTVTAQRLLGDFFLSAEPAGLHLGQGIRPLWLGF